jgi:RND family efflux transporter MFP subunit
MIATRRIVFIAIGIAVVFLVLLAIGAVPRVRENRALAAAAKQAQNPTVRVGVVRPVPSPEGELMLAATTQALRSAVIYARTSGYIGKRYVDIGDRVKAGQPLAVIESPEVDQQLRQARADLAQAERTLELQQATRDLAQVTMRRYQAADEQGAVALEALDQSISAYRTAQAAVAAAEASVDSYKANVQHFVELTSFERVTAPFTGTVTQRNVDVGTLITAGSPTDNTALSPSTVSGAANGLFEVSDLDTLRVFVTIPQVYAPNIKPGLPAQVTVRGQLTTPVAGSVTRTANALDPTSRTLLTEHHLLAGMFVYVNFGITPSGTRWRVPATAVIVDAQGTRVAIVTPKNTIHFQHVDVGRDLGTSIDIQAGLTGSDTIVAQPTVALQEGEVVSPIQPTSTH